MNNLHKIGLGLMLLILAACQNKEKAYKDHYPADKQEFITDIQDRFNKIKATEGPVSKDSTATLIREAHLHFYHHYPVYYDWWLQDGSDVKWFDKTLPEQISERLQKLQQETKVTNTPESITQALSAYLDACKARREQRLASFIKNTPEVVFTKFRTLRPSFFAYTEGLSDARAECNFFAGGELAYFKMDGIWAKEETLFISTVNIFSLPGRNHKRRMIFISMKWRCRRGN